MIELESAWGCNRFGCELSGLHPEPSWWIELEWVELEWVELELSWSRVELECSGLSWSWLGVGAEWVAS